MKSFFLAAALLVPIASYAADMPVKAPVAPPIHNWTGFYVGGNLGGGWADQGVSFRANDPSANVTFSDTTAGVLAPPRDVSFGMSGITGGVQLGYNYQLNPKWLVGIEADFEGSNVRGSAIGTGVHGISPFTVPVDESVKWFGTVRGRLGFLPAPNLLAYVTGGFAYGQVNRGGSWIYNGDPAAFIFGLLPGTGVGTTCGGGVAVVCWQGSSSRTQTGWTVGGGLEYALWQHWTIRAEYLYVRLDGNSVTERNIPSVALPAGLTPSSFNANFDSINLNTARVGLSYRFN